MSEEFWRELERVMMAKNYKLADENKTLTAQLRERDRRIAKARKILGGTDIGRYTKALQALAAPRKAKR